MKPLEEAFISFINDPQSKAKVALSAKTVAENRRGAGKRKKGCLTAMEVEHTLRLLGGKRLAHENIAAEVGICAQSVLNVSRRARADPEYLSKLFDLEEARERVKSLSLGIIGEKKASGAPIWNVAQLMEELRERFAADTSARHLRKLLKTEACMTYRKIKRLSL